MVDASEIRSPILCKVDLCFYQHCILQQWDLTAKRNGSVLLLKPFKQFLASPTTWLGDPADPAGAVTTTLAERGNVFAAQVPEAVEPLLTNSAASHSTWWREKYEMILIKNRFSSHMFCVANDSMPCCVCQGQHKQSHTSALQKVERSRKRKKFLHMQSSYYSL